MVRVAGPPIGGVVTSGADGRIECGASTLGIPVADGNGVLQYAPSFYGGGTSRKCGPASYAWGDTVTLTASPREPGAVFLGWAGDCTGVGTCTLTAGADLTVVAMFGRPGSAHPNFMAPAVHAPAYVNQAYGGNPLVCTDCHGPTLRGMGIAPSCATCHGWPLGTGGSTGSLVASFVATPGALTAGQATTLSWSAPGAQTVSIDQGIGVVTGSSVVASPAATTTYTLTASSYTQTSSRTVTVEVQAPAGSTLTGPPRLDVVAEQGSQVEAQFTLRNPGASPRTAALGVTNAHADLGVSFQGPGTVTVPAGAEVVLTVLLDARVALPGTYEDLLLSVSVDDGSSFASNLSVEVTPIGTGPAPILVVRSSDIRVVSIDPGVSLTLAADVRNVGNAPAANVRVSFYDFSTFIGSDTLSAVPAGGTGTATITAPVITPGDHVITVVLTDGGTPLREAGTGLAALLEPPPPFGIWRRAEASRVIRIETAALDAGILVLGSLPVRVCLGTPFVTLAGHATYDLTVNGVRTDAYVVKGAPVDTSVLLPSGATVNLGRVHTDVAGDYVTVLPGPSAAGFHRIFTTITDKTFTGRRELVFEAAVCSGEPGGGFPPRPVVPGEGCFECPPPPPPEVGAMVCPPPLPPATGSERFQAYCESQPADRKDRCCTNPTPDCCVYVCTANCRPPDPGQPVYTDAYVYAENVFFTQDRPAVGETITLFAEIDYWSDLSWVVARDVVVHVTVTLPGTLPDEVARVTIPSISVGSPDYGALYVYTLWTPPSEGVYIVEFAIDRISTESYAGNNAATRALIVGDYTPTLGTVSGHATWLGQGVAGAVVTVYAANGSTVIGSTVTDASGLYVIGFVPPGDHVVGIQPPLGYVAVTERKDATLAANSLATVDFTLSTVGISPSSATVLAGESFQFSATGGVPPFAWSLATQGTGASITQDGLYTAGPEGSVVDRVAVTDSLGASVEARITVNPTWAMVDLDTGTLAILSDGSLWAWGGNWNGQLGDGTQAHRIKPVQIGTGYSMVATARWHTLAVKRDGTVWTWGDNSVGQLGNGTIINRSTPGQVFLPLQAGDRVTKISAAGSQSFVLTSSGRLFGWGNNGAKAIAELDPPRSWTSVPVLIAGTYRDVAAGGSFTAAVGSDGTLFTWGANNSGQRGDPLAGPEATGIPTAIGTGFASVSAGGTHAFATRIDGSIVTWGGNSVGQLGIGSFLSPSPQVPFDPALTGATLFAFLNRSAALMSDGTLHAWGLNDQGQLGIGNLTNQSSPVRVEIGPVAQVDLGAATSGALTRTGALFTWGKNDEGQLGDGSTLSSSTPVLVPLPEAPSTSAPCTNGPRYAGEVCCADGLSAPACCGATSLPTGMQCCGGTPLASGLTCCSAGNTVGACTDSLTITALPATSTGTVVTPPWGGQSLQCYWTLEFANSAPFQVQFTGYAWTETNDVYGKWTGDCGADCAPAYRMGASASFQNGGWYAYGGIRTDANGNYAAPERFTVQWTLDYVIVGDVTGTVRKASTPVLTCNPP